MTMQHDKKKSAEGPQSTRSSASLDKAVSLDAEDIHGGSTKT